MANWTERLEEVVAAAYNELSPRQKRHRELVLLLVRQELDKQSTNSIANSLLEEMAADPLFNEEYPDEE